MRNGPTNPKASLKNFGIPARKNLLPKVLKKKKK